MDSVEGRSAYGKRHDAPAILAEHFQNRVLPETVGKFPRKLRGDGPGFGLCGILAGKIGAFRIGDFA